MEKDNTALLNDIRQLLNELKQQIACLEVKIDALSAERKAPVEDDMIDLWMEETAAASSSVEAVEAIAELQEDPGDGIAEDITEAPEVTVEEVIEETKVEEEPANVIVEETPVDSEPAAKHTMIFEDPSLESEEAESPFCGLEPESSTGFGHVTDSVAERGCVADEPANQNPGEIAVGQVEEENSINEPEKKFQTLEEMFASFFGMPLPKDSEPEPAHSFKPVLKQEPKTEQKPEPKTEPEQKTEQESEPETEAIPEKKPEPQVSVFAGIPEETNPRRRSLADRMMIPSETWRTDIPGSPVKDIKSAISLNDRVMMIRSLFSNDAETFQTTITAINGMDSLDSAVNYLQKNFSTWKWDSDTVYKFMMAVRRKFN